MSADSRRVPRAAVGASSGPLSFDRPVQWLLAALAAVLIVGPLLPILLQSLVDKPLYEPDRAFTLGNYTRILGSAEVWSTIGTTLVFAVATTALAVGLGTGMAVVLGRTDVPSGAALHDLVLVPFYVSPLV